MKYKFFKALLIAGILITCIKQSLLAQEKTNNWTPEEQKELFGYCEKRFLINDLKIPEDKADKIGQLNYWATLQKIKVEENTLESALDKVVNQSDEYQDIKIIVHELAFKGMKIYQKANVDEKRLLMSQLFTNFTQNCYEIKPNFNLACEYLVEWMPKLNEAYELQKTLTTKGKESTFALSHPVLLRG